MISSNGTSTGHSSNGHTADVEIDVEDIALLTGLRDRFATSPRLEFGRYVFKQAETADELEQVHRLNYQTFVQEVGQYEDNGAEILVDKFHDKNTYFIALQDGEVVGMLAFHDQQPFSAASRMPEGKTLDQLGSRLIEVRLFAVCPDKRSGPVSKGLMWLVFEYAHANNYSHLIISGIESRRRLYERMGFRPLGPAVPDGDAAFIPMAMAVHRTPENITRDAQRLRAKYLREVATRPHAPVSLLPGPVHLADSIRQAVSERPESHRGEEFVQRYESVRRILSDMVGGLNTAIMVGSGTLANEVVGATLAADRNIHRGLILRNGEFGRRLAAQAARYDLEYDEVEWPWGHRWDLDQVAEALDRDPSINWIWAVHLETSVGMVNDIDALFDLCQPRGVKVCLDCVSSLGALDMDLSRAHLAAGVSGKSIGALAGLAFIFAHSGALDSVDDSRLPVYLDLRAAMQTEGPRFTVSSPVMNALARAVDEFATPHARAERYARYADLGRYVRRRLKRLGFRPMVDGPDAAPVITSFTPPPGISSARFCEQCLEWGFEISGLSGYLLERGIVQIATMGDVRQRDCARLFACIRTSQSSKKSTPAAS